MFIGIGTSIGVSLGSIFNNTGLGISLGISFGTGLGICLCLIFGVAMQKLKKVQNKDS